MQLSIPNLIKLMGYLANKTEVEDAMLASLKQRDRGRKVAADSSLQAKTRQREQKWQRKLGLDASQVQAEGPTPCLRAVIPWPSPPPRAAHALRSASTRRRARRMVGRTCASRV